MAVYRLQLKRIIFFHLRDIDIFSSGIFLTSLVSGKSLRADDVVGVPVLVPDVEDHHVICVVPVGLIDRP